MSVRHNLDCLNWGKQICPLCVAPFPGWDPKLFKQNGSWAVACVRHSLFLSCISVDTMSSASSASCCLDIPIMVGCRINPSIWCHIVATGKETKMIDYVYVEKNMECIKFITLCRLRHSLAVLKCTLCRWWGMTAFFKVMEAVVLRFWMVQILGLSYDAVAMDLRDVAEMLRAYPSWERALGTHVPCRCEQALYCCWPLELCFEVGLIAVFGFTQSCVHFISGLPQQSVQDFSTLPL